MVLNARTWIDRYAEALGIPTPPESEVEALLELAGTAAHAAERTAAPISCWLAARAGRSPDEALAVARALEASLDSSD